MLYHKLARQPGTLRCDKVVDQSHNDGKYFHDHVSSLVRCTSQKRSLLGWYEVDSVGQPHCCNVTVQCYFNSSYFGVARFAFLKVATHVGKYRQLHFTPVVDGKTVLTRLNAAVLKFSLFECGVY